MVDPDEDPQYARMLFEPLDLGVVEIGRAKRVRVFVHSSRPLTGGVSLEIEQPHSAGFSAAGEGECSTTGLVGGTWCTVSIRFKPTRPGEPPPVTLRASGVTKDGRPAQGSLGLTGSGSAWTIRPVPEYTTSGGGAIARSVAGNADYLHVVAANLEEAWVNYDDASVYLRTADEGLTWDQELMIGGAEPTVAAAGRHVYVAFQAYSCGGGVGVMRNGDHGRRAAWSTVSCLTRDRDINSMWAPAIAATGSLVYVTSIDPATGRAVVWSSRDHGRTWAKQRLGSSDAEGWPPNVAATGAIAAVAWTNDGVARVRMTLNEGRDWGSPTRLATGSVTGTSAGGTRLAFSGIDGACDGEADEGGIAWGKTWTDSGPWVDLKIPGPARSCMSSWGAAVVLGPGQELGLASYLDAESDRMVWRSSPDNGITWGSPEPFPGGGEKLSLVWSDNGRIFSFGAGRGDYTYGVAVHHPTVAASP